MCVPSFPPSIAVPPLWEVAHRLPKEGGQVSKAHEPPEHPNVMAAVEQMEGGEVGGEDAGEAGAQEEYAQGAQGQGEEGQAGVEYGQAGAEGVQYTEGGEEYTEGAKAEDEMARVQQHSKEIADEEEKDMEKDEAENEQSEREAAPRSHRGTPRTDGLDPGTGDGVAPWICFSHGHGPGGSLRPSARTRAQPPRTTTRRIRRAFSRPGRRPPRWT